ncbi:hypothetical protein [Chakrabartyella piscis]|uniref:hypothetical protein n=1 Tax=Chakrabartyella piscis TaxID=2918914 RepID=UPI002958844B|nr:hypothetical protein [Chakrabartyella piscis]
MANNITLAKNYTDLLDEVYQNASVTADLTSDASLMKAGANAKEILYPQVDVDGLGDYDRSSGYTDSSVSVVWKTAEFNYDRGAKISVDAMDNQETFDIAFGMAGGELQRTKVAPEADAFVFATIAGTEGISVAEPATYEGGAAFLSALLVATSQMDEDEVPEENRLLYATPTLVNSVMALETTESREVLAKFTTTKKVPQSRFYTAIDLLDGKSTGEEAGHYKKAEDGLDINFMIIHKPAIIKFDKHTASAVIAPDSNPNADGYISKYRKYGIVDVYKNKVAGIYLSHKAAVVEEADDDE